MTDDQRLRADGGYRTKPRMGRPRVDVHRVSLQSYVKPWIKTKVEDRAEAAKCSVSQYIELVLEAYFSK